MSAVNSSQKQKEKMSLVPTFGGLMEQETAFLHPTTEIKSTD